MCVREVIFHIFCSSNYRWEWLTQIPMIIINTAWCDGEKNISKKVKVGVQPRDITAREPSCPRKMGKPLTLHLLLMFGLNAGVHAYKPALPFPSFCSPYQWIHLSSYRLLKKSIHDREEQKPDCWMTDPMRIRSLKSTSGGVNLVWTQLLTSLTELQVSKEQRRRPPATFTISTVISYLLLANKWP